MSIKRREIWKSILRSTIIGTVTVLIVVCIRIFLIASFHIPSASMTPTLLPGDFILTNKLIPGPRMDWLYLFNKKEYKRAKGSRAVQRDDVIVFNPPYYQSNELKKNMGIYYVKRCLGIPGDSIYMDKNRTYQLIKKGDPTPAKKVFYIPKKDDEILIDSNNIHFYQKIIEYDRSNDSKNMDINELRGKYRFRYDYYYVAGDNSADSEDSRYWGLLPETHIVGTVSCIWRSVDPKTKKIRWNRFFKPLDTL